MTGGASPGRALRSVRSAVVGISTILILSIVAADLVGAAPVGGAAVLWTRQFGSPSVDESFAVAATPEAIYVAGYAVGALGGSPQGGEDVIVRKYQMSGEVIWTDRFGTSSSEEALGISATPDALYVVGYTEGELDGQSAFGGWDGFIRRYDTSGNVVWTRQFGTPELERAYGVVATSSGIYVAGSTAGQLPGQSNEGDWDAFVRKYDPSGDPVWTLQFGTEGHDGAFGISADGSHVYVTGSVEGALDGAHGEGTGFVRKIEIDGGHVWTRQFDAGSPAGVAAVPEGAYVAGGGTLGAFVSKLSVSGEVEWTRTFGTGLSGQAKGISANANGAIVVGWTGGECLPGPTCNSGHVFVRRYDRSGRAVWTTQFGPTWTIYSPRAWGHSIAASSKGIFAVGSTEGAFPGQTASGGLDAFLVRLARYRPDTWISTRRSTRYVGDGIYSKDGGNQYRIVRTRRGKSATFYVRIQNDGHLADRFRLQGCGSSSGFTIKYLRGSTDITSKVVGGRYGFKLAPDAETTIRLTIAVKHSAKVGSWKECLVRATSTAAVGDPTRNASGVDIVKARVRAG